MEVDLDIAARNGPSSRIELGRELITPRPPPHKDAMAR
jgi:hypothetical protein